MRRLAWRLLLATAILSGCASSPPSTPDPAQFVSVSGPRFYLQGQPYYFVGANFWYGAYLGAPGDLGNRARLRKELDLLSANGITNLRVLAISENSDLSRSVDPAVIKAPGRYNDQLLEGLDFLLMEMAKRNMKAVLYLTNFWQWSGGMSQHVSWVTGEPVLDPDLTNQWNAYMQTAARFYQLESAQKIYQDAVKEVVTRENSFTGVKYNQDPTIMSWQLANEPRPGSDEAGHINFQHFVEWIDQTAAFIKSLAPHQLVSTGNEGHMGSLRDDDRYIIAHMSPNIDYLTFHLWLKNWGWFDAERPELTYPDAINEAKAYINRHVDMAVKMNKPTVLSEFGAERDAGSFDPNASTHYRDKIYREIYATVEARAAAGDAIAGTNFWTWGGYGRANHPDYIWQTGDDFTGDPPQEHQGLNSVFNTDTPTIELIREHGLRMLEIQEKMQKTSPEPINSGD